MLSIADTTCPSQRDGDALVLFGRYPELGATKTRLAADLGHEATLALYEALLCDTAAKLSSLDGCTPIAFLACSHQWTSLPADPLQRDPFSRFMMLRQPNLDFGGRLSAALKGPLNMGFRKVVLVGADSPELSIGDLREALDRLEQSDVVLGPAEDGGYYLIGLRRFVPELFRGIHWSTSTVASETIDAAQSTGHGIELIRMLPDIDYMKDLRALKERRLRTAEPEKPSVCPATDAWLRNVLSTVMSEDGR